MQKAIDITGDVFGRLTAIEMIGSNGSGARWLCQCSCGGSVVARGTALRHGQIKSCGCWRRERGWGTTRKDFTGERFGKLTCINPCKDFSNRASWNCLCDCGKTTIVRTGLLTSGNTKSCGCGQNKNKGSMPVVSGLYAVLFSSGVVKFGRSDNVRRRASYYKREAIFAGGAKLYVSLCDNQKECEKALIKHASATYKTILAESFADVSETEVMRLLAEFAGSEPYEIVGMFHQSRPTQP